VALFDPVKKVGGMIHIMLPEQRSGKGGDNPWKYADTGIPLLVDEVVKNGAMQSRIIAKLAGGAQMFSTTSNSPLLAVGDRNIKACKQILRDMRIPVLGELLGGNTGKTFEMDLATGSFSVRVIGKEPVTI
jgi:chemotaxis protein CheD